MGKHEPLVNNSNSARLDRLEARFEQLHTQLATLALDPPAALATAGAEAVATMRFEADLSSLSERLEKLESKVAASLSILNPDTTLVGAGMEKRLSSLDSRLSHLEGLEVQKARILEKLISRIQALEKRKPRGRPKKKRVLKSADKAAAGEGVSDAAS